MTATAAFDGLKHRAFQRAIDTLTATLVFIVAGMVAAWLDAPGLVGVGLHLCAVVTAVLCYLSLRQFVSYFVAEAGQ
jgi:hypothetical protein